MGIIDNFNVIREFTASAYLVLEYNEGVLHFALKRQSERGIVGIRAYCVADDIERFGAAFLEKKEEALAKAMELAGKDGVVLSFGSLYTICDVRDGLLSVLASNR